MRQVVLAACILGIATHLDEDQLAEAVEGDAWAQVMPVDERHLRNARIPRGRPILDFLLLQTNDVNCDTLRTLDVVRKQEAGEGALASSIGLMLWQNST